MVQTPLRTAKPFAPLLDFAPDEVCRSGGVAAAEVGSYPAISPLSSTQHWAAQKIRINHGVLIRKSLSSVYSVVKNSSWATQCWVLDGIFSVALSVPSPDRLRGQMLSPGVTRHHALRSPDFPLRVHLSSKRAAAVWFIAIITIYKSTTSYPSS